jgi:hypothetical protein
MGKVANPFQQNTAIAAGEEPLLPFGFFGRIARI